MAKVNYIQTNFSSGEFSPQLEGRVDIAKYANGAKKLENVLVKAYGGVYRRPGTYYVAEVKDSTKATRLVSFQFSVTQAYILEFGDQYMRVYKDNGQVQSGGAAYEMATPYLEADLFELQFAQSADVLYVAHKDYAPRKITRTDHDAWTIATITFTWGPFLPENDTAITLNPSGVAGSIALVASADLFDADHVGAYFKITNGATIGYVQITTVTDAQNAVATVKQTVATGAVTTWCEGAWSDYRGYPGSVTFFEQRLWWGGSTHKPQTLWASQTDDYENMETGADDADALVYTISDNQVNAISWLMPLRSLVVGTVGGSFVVDTGDGLPVTPSNVSIRKELSYRSARIVPKMIGQFLYYIQANEKTVREIGYDYSTDSFIGNDATLLAEHITGSGIVDMDVQEAPDNVLWCVRADGEIACMTRQVEQQVTAWTRIITDGEFKSVAIIPNGAEDQVWVIVERIIDGNTKKYIEYFKPSNFDEQEDCFFADCGLTLDSPDDIEGITKANPCVITATGHSFVDGDRIRLRGIKGMTELNDRYFLVDDAGANTFEITDLAGTDIDSRLYGDYESAGEIRKCVNSVSGLDHLEGESVKVLVDGGTHPACVVSSGAITLNGYYSEVHAGLANTPYILTLRPETGSSMGAAQGMTKRIYKAIVRLFESLGVKMGTEDTQDAISFRLSGDPLSKAPDMFTGDKEISFPGGYTKDGRICITQDEPLPLTVLAIMYKLTISDE